MRRIAVILLVLLCMVQGALASTGEGGKEPSPPPEGAALPEMKLPVPPKLEQRDYLGIKEGEYFKVSDTKADVVIIEVFSMYCPFCQKEAPNVNALQGLIAKRPELIGRIKFIGIGAGNSTYEVHAFRNLYGISFPLVPDVNFTFHKALGEVRTPCFIVVRLGPDKSNKIIYSRVGSFGDPQQFLDLILQRSGLDKGK